MINSRDSYTDFNPSSEEIIEVPYRIGTVVVLKDNPDVLARIMQYRITVDNFRQVISVGLNTNIYEKEEMVNYEIPLEELEEKWKKTDRIIVGGLDSEDCLHITEISKQFDRDKKLELTRFRNN